MSDKLDEEATYKSLFCKPINSSEEKLQLELHANLARNRILITLSSCNGSVLEHFGGGEWETISEWGSMLLAAFDKINSEEDFKEVFEKEFAPLILNYRSHIKSTIIH